MISVAVLMSALAFVCSRSVGIPLHDPDGFLGPAYLRLPLLCIGAFAADMIPRTLWRTRGNPRQFKTEAVVLIREHWTRERIILVILGLISFYFTYVSYRNLKNFLPFMRTTSDGHPLLYDNQLHALDRWLLFGNDPAIVLHKIFGFGFSAHILAYDYLLFLPLVPVTVTAWLVWSRNISFGYWYVTSQGLCWTLGTASYYILPTLGPGFAFPWLYFDIDKTGVSSLQDSLFYGRIHLHFDPFLNGVQSVAGFASLHVAITLMMALVGHYTVRHRWIRIALWVYVVVTAISTTYFGWHYIADDIAGAFIAVVSFYLGALATGQKFDDRGRKSHPTTTTRGVPVDSDVG
jgi:membrane-associated phospholipid phosphatase